MPSADADGVDTHGIDLLDLVELHGLKTTSLNGTRAAVIDTLPCDSSGALRVGRWAVQCCDGSTRCVQVKNLRPHRPALSADSVAKLDSLRKELRGTPCRSATVEPRKQVQAALLTARQALGRAALGLLDIEEEEEQITAPNGDIGARGGPRVAQHLAKVAVAACKAVSRAAAGPDAGVPTYMQQPGYDMSDRGVPGWRPGSGTCQDPAIAAGFVWPPLATLCTMSWQCLSMFGACVVPELLRRGMSAHHVFCTACCAPGSEDIVTQLLREHPALRAAIDAPCPGPLFEWEEGRALMFAVGSRSLRLVSLVLAAGADVNGRQKALRTDNNGGTTALWKAAEHGSTRIVRRLLHAGADVRLAKTEPWGNTPLHVAAQNGRDGSALALLRAGCSPDIRNSGGCSTPAVSAVLSGKATVLALLLKHNSTGAAQLAEKDFYSETGLVKKAPAVMSLLKHAAKLPMNALTDEVRLNISVVCFMQVMGMVPDEVREREEAWQDTPDLECARAVIEFQYALSLAHGSALLTWPAARGLDRVPGVTVPDAVPEPAVRRAKVETALQRALRQLDSVERRAAARGSSGGGVITAAALRVRLHALYCRSAVLELAGEVRGPEALRACVDALEMVRDRPEVLREGDGAEECAICLEALRQPQRLPCGHRFCCTCMARLRGSARDAHAVQACPSCRAPIPGGYAAATEEGDSPAAGGGGGVDGGDSDGDAALCAHCGKSGAHLRCTRCKAARYCTKACQRAAWKTHKAPCAEAARALVAQLAAVDALSLRELRQALEAHGVAHAQCIEKSDFRALLCGALEKHGVREAGGGGSAAGVAGAAGHGGAGGGSGAVAAAVAMAHILEHHDLPRLTAAAHGPGGSDHRVLLCRRRRPLVDELMPPLLTHASWATFEGVAFRLGGKTLLSEIITTRNSPMRPEVWAFDASLAEQAGDASGVSPWRELRCTGTAPAGRHSHSAVCTADGKMVVFGGNLGHIGDGSSKHMNDVHTLDLRATPPRWERLAVRGALPAPRSGHAACMGADGSMYVSCGESCGGGRDGHASDFNDVWRLNLQSLKWKLIRTSGALPHGRHEHVMWFEPSGRGSDGDGDSDGGGGNSAGGGTAAASSSGGSVALPSDRGSLLIYGGEIFPGCGIPGCTWDGEDGRGTQSEGGVVHALDLATGVWRARCVLGQSPGRLQEMGVLSVAPRSGSGGGGGVPPVVLWGGYTESCGVKSKQVDEEAHAQKQFHEELNGISQLSETHLPYRRGVFVYEDRVWRALRCIGDMPTLCAQACLVQTAPCRFSVVGGYGITATTEVHERTEEMRAVFRAMGHEEQASNSEQSFTPECMVASYACTMFDAAAAAAAAAAAGGSSGGGSDACYGEAAHFSAMSFHAATAGGALPSPPPRVGTMWMIMHPDGGKSRLIDIYNGPIDPRLFAKLRAVGWSESTPGSNQYSMLAEPDVQGSAFQPSSGIIRETRAMTAHARRGSDEDVMGRCALVFHDWATAAKREAGARAAAYADELRRVFRRRRAAPAPDNDVPPHLTLRVNIVGISPEIWREVRVTPTMTLNELADQVLCPAFGYTRNYHAHAFQSLPRTPEGAPEALCTCQPGACGGGRDGDDAPPWLGPTKCTSLDMAQLPFFIGALGDDHIVPLGALLREVGDQLAFVFDFGDWWEHRISVSAVGGEQALGAAAEVLGGALAGPPCDIGGPGLFASNLNVLTGIAASHEHKSQVGSPQVLSPESADWWAYLNAQFRNQNSSEVVYAPLRFDLEAVRARVSTALRGQRSRAAEAGGHALIYSANGGGARNANEPMERAGGVGSACVVCHATAGLRACSGCNFVWYCCREHQAEHWKAHKPECKRLQKAAAGTGGGGGGGDDGGTETKKPSQKKKKKKKR